MQYRRAVQLYYRKFKAYPPNMDALVKTSDIRFLRKKYVDPMTGKDDWKSIAFGQNKTPTAMGFFGEPLAGNASTIAGTGPSGNNTPGMTNPTGSATSGFSLGASPGSSTPGPSSLDSSGTGTPGATGSSPSGTGSSGSSDSGTGLTGQTFGGAGIIGFEPASPKQSILVYKKKDHYNEWEFTYDPLSDMKTMGGGNTGGIGQPAGSTTSPVGASPFGNPGSTTSPTTGGTGNGPGPGSSFGSPSMPPDTSAPQ